MPDRLLEHLDALDGHRLQRHAVDRGRFRADRAGAILCDAYQWVRPNGSSKVTGTPRRRAWAWQ